MNEDRIEDIIKKIGKVVIVVIAILVGFIIFRKAQISQIEEYSYNNFLKLVDEGKVKEVNLNNRSERFIFTTEDDESYITDNPKTDEFKEFLLKKDIDVEVESITLIEVLIEVLFILPRLLLLTLIIRVIMSSMGSISKKDTLVSNVPKIGLDSVAGHKESKRDMEFLIGFLKNPNKYHKIGARLPKGVILYGPPGTGKTLTARAIAGEAGVPFFNISGSDFMEMYVGLGAKRVRDLFKDAREKAPCIVFIDEIDAIGTKRGGVGGGNSEKDQTINALLAELDGFSTKEGIIVMAATNRVEDLDKALIRPGRFDRHIAINLPDKDDRLEIIEVHTRNKKVGKDVNLRELAKITIGFSGATIETLLNEAAIIAVNNGGDCITKKDIDEAYFKIVMKGHKRKSETNFDKRQLVAYHEAGHALSAKLLTNNSVPKVTIIPSTSGAGGATFNIPESTSLLSQREILNNIKVLYGGRAAEYILLGSEKDITTGASQDIKKATNYIKKYFYDFGMSDKYGMVNLQELYGPNAKVDIDEVVKLSKELYQEVSSLLEDNRSILEKIAKELIEKETINESDLDRIIEDEKMSRSANY